MSRRLSIESYEGRDGQFFSYVHVYTDLIGGDLAIVETKLSAATCPDIVSKIFHKVAPLILNKYIEVDD